MKTLLVHCVARLFCSALIVIGIWSCIKDEIPEDNVTSHPQKILFIGNSHTYYNDGIDTYLKGFINSNDTLTYEVIKKEAKPGYRLLDHWVDPETRGAIQSEDWDRIVLQENTWLVYEEPHSLQTYVDSFKSIISPKDTKLTLFMTWAYQDSMFMIETISSAYQQVGENLSLPIVEIGLGWKDLLEIYGEIDLYDADRYHPNRNGSYFAAAVFYAFFYQANPQESTYLPTNMDLQTAQILQESAWETYLKYH